MIISGRFLPSDPFETYHSKWWGARDRAYQPKKLNRFDLRQRGRGYHRSAHADWIWTNWLGRVLIAKTRRAA